MEHRLDAYLDQQDRDDDVAAQDPDRPASPVASLFDKFLETAYPVPA